MEFDYKSITPESKRLLINGHQNKEMAQILDSIIANGITLLPDNRDGDIENICGINVTHRFVKSAGESEKIEWHFVEAGQGEVLLLLHGIPQSWRMWTPILPELSKSFRCIAIDLKGYGQSYKGRGDYRHEGVADLVARPHVHEDVGPAQRRRLDVAQLHGRHVVRGTRF